MKKLFLSTLATCALFSCAYNKVPINELSPVTPLDTNQRLLSFKLDIQPIFEQYCNSCHSSSPTDPINTPGYALFDDLSELQNYALEPSSADKKYTLIQAQIRFIESPGMPYNKPPLPDSLIKKIESWISLGAPIE